MLITAALSALSAFEDFNTTPENKAVTTERSIINAAIRLFLLNFVKLYSICSVVFF